MHLSTYADTSTETKKILLLRPNLEQQKKLFLRGDFTLFMSKSFTISDNFFPLLFSKDSEYIKSLDIGLQAKKTFKQRFYTLYEQKYANLSLLLYITFPQGFQISKMFGHWTWESGGKKTVKQSEKV